MTDDQIDFLEGRVLDSAVARAKCWAGDEMFPRYSTNHGLAIELLLGNSVMLCGDEKCGFMVSLLADPDKSMTLVEADGETFPVAACRAFLKLKRMESDRNVARNCLGSTDRGENGLYGEIGR